MSYSSYRYRRHWWAIIGIVFVVLLITACTVGYGAMLHASQRNVTTVVTNHERVCNSGGGSCQYLVYTTNGTFKDTDSFWYGKFRSSDLYGQIKNNESYTFEVTGWRLPFFSTYPNIVKIVSDNGPSS